MLVILNRVTLEMENFNFDTEVFHFTTGFLNPSAMLTFRDKGVS